MVKCRIRHLIQIRNDNGTHFLGSERERDEGVFEKINQNKVKYILHEGSIHWEFNLFFSPCMGGAMDVLVKITKKSLKTIMTV